MRTSTTRRSRWHSPRRWMRTCGTRVRSDRWRPDWFARRHAFMSPVGTEVVPSVPSSSCLARQLRTVPIPTPRWCAVGLLVLRGGKNANGTETPTAPVQSTRGAHYFYHDHHKVLTPVWSCVNMCRVMVPVDTNEERANRPRRRRTDCRADSARRRAVRRRSDRHGQSTTVTHREGPLWQRCSVGDPRCGQAGRRDLGLKPGRQSVRADRDTSRRTRQWSGPAGERAP